MKKNKRIRNKIYFSRVVLIFFVGIVLLLLYNSLSLFYKKNTVWKKVKILEREKKELIERKENLKKELLDLEESQGVESILREKFNVVRVGEEVIVLTEPKISDSLNKEKKPFFSRIKDFFIKN